MDVERVKYLYVLSNNLFRYSKLFTKCEGFTFFGINQNEKKNKISGA